MGLTFSRERKKGLGFKAEISDPILFTSAVAGVAASVYILKRTADEVAALESRRIFPFSDYCLVAAAGSLATATVLPQEKGRAPWVYYETKRGEQRLAEVPPDSMGRVVDVALKSGASLRSDSSALEAKMTMMSIFSEALGWATTLLGASVAYRLWSDQQDANSGPEPQTVPQVKFSDVAGHDDTKTELAEIVRYLRSPRSFEALGAHPPRGVLFEGPSGCGKSLLARAVAGEAGVAFFSCAASQFVEVFVGQGARRIRGIFELAKKNAPSILLIDELDAVGMARPASAGGGGGTQEHVQTINQLLVELDAIKHLDHDRPVVVIAATNRFDTLDEALVRPGRFDRCVRIELPDERARVQLFRIHTRTKRLSADVDFQQLAALTAGYSGADVEALVNAATLKAARLKKPAVDRAALLAEIATIDERRRQQRERRKQSGEDMSLASSLLRAMAGSAAHRWPDVNATD